MPQEEQDQLATNSTLRREDITERGREPQDHLARPGWSVWTPEGPLAQSGENTHLGQADVADEQAYTRNPSADRGDPTNDLVAEPRARDFRVDEEDPGLIKPVTE